MYTAGIMYTYIYIVHRGSNMRYHGTGRAPKTPCRLRISTVTTEGVKKEEMIFIESLLRYAFYHYG